MSGLAETDESKPQLDAGEEEMPNILSAVKDSGAIDVTLGEGDEMGAYKTAVIRNRNCQSSTRSEPQCQKATQTELVFLFIKADAMIQGAVKDTHL